MRRIATLAAGIALMAPGTALAESSSTCEAYNPQTCNSIDPQQSRVDLRGDPPVHGSGRRSARRRRWNAPWRRRRRASAVAPPRLSAHITGSNKSLAPDSVPAILSATNEWETGRSTELEERTAHVSPARSEASNGGSGNDASVASQKFGGTKRCHRGMPRKDAESDVHWRCTRIRGRRAAPPGAPRLQSNF